jgi:hypothetical protein
MMRTLLTSGWYWLGMSSSRYEGSTQASLPCSITRLELHFRTPSTVTRSPAAHLTSANA